jgi:tryptophan-rich sensory protein
LTASDAAGSGRADPEGAMRGVATWLGWVLLTGVAAAVGGVASRSAAGFYGTLDRPPWAPPAWLFGPAWAVLYLLMATAAWLVSRAGGPGSSPALGVYVAQLVANAAWTWIFFALRRGAWAFAEVLVLLALVALTLAAFWRVRPLAGLLLVPYLAWVSFATALTYSVWRRNPDLL